MTENLTAGYEKPTIEDTDQQGNGQGAWDTNYVDWWAEDVEYADQEKDESSQNSRRVDLAEHHSQLECPSQEAHTTVITQDNEVDEPHPKDCFGKSAPPLEQRKAPATKTNSIH